MKNENAIMDRIKARIAYHANEHRHTYEIGKGVMDFLARDLLADFKAAGGLLPPVVLDGDVYVIYRRKPVKAKVIFIGINADRVFLLQRASRKYKGELPDVPVHRKRHRPKHIPYPGRSRKGGGLNEEEKIKPSEVEI